MRFAFKFAYDGRKFHGYARQPNLRTVEGEFLKVLTEYGFIQNPRVSFFRSASRTDKGVSAMGNVVAFNTSSSKEDIMDVLSNELTEVIVYGVKQVTPVFNPRYARYRWYRYYLVDQGLDVERILSVASFFTGEHDFSNFARVEEFRNPVRILDNIVFILQEGFLVIDFFAQSFLWQQVRRIVSVLEKIGKGKLEEKQVKTALSDPGEKFDFGLVSPVPLILKDVVYDFVFECDKVLFKKACNLEEQVVSSLLD